MPRLSVDQAIQAVKDAIRLTDRNPERARATARELYEWARSLDRHRLVTHDYATADQFFGYIRSDLAQAGEGVLPAMTVRALKSALRHMDDHQRLLRIANGESAAQEMTTAEKVGTGIVLAGVLVPVIVYAASAAGPASLAAAGAVTARVGLAARLSIVVCQYPIAAVEITGISAGAILTFAESGLSLGHGIDAFFAYLAFRGPGGGVAWARAGARRNGTENRPRYRVESVESVQGPPPGTTPKGIQALSISRPVNIGSLVESAREQAAFSHCFTNSGRPGCVSVIRDTRGGDHVGASRRVNVRAPELMDAEVQEMAELIESALHARGLRGNNGHCAEPLSISNMIRQGVPTKGAVSVAVNPSSGQIMRPCPNCEYLLRHYGIAWINEHQQLER